MTDPQCLVFFIREIASDRLPRKAWRVVLYVSSYKLNNAMNAFKLFRSEKGHVGEY